MSDIPKSTGGLMDTVPGGENRNPYEDEASDMIPHAKQAGQLGNPATGTSTERDTRKTNEPNTQGVTPAEKIRYGQSIQEGGAGGKTTGLGDASTEGGFGGTEALDQEDPSAAKERREQGYGGDRDMDRTIGA